MKAPISIVIPTRNEERNIRAAIHSVREWADEIFVLDSYSDDATVEIVREMGASIAQRQFDNFAKQKNWALDNLPFRNDWVLLLDADERIPVTLQEEIINTLSRRSDCYNGYFIARNNYFMGKCLRHGGWSPDWNLRFFKHRFGRYEDRIVHEHVILVGRAGYLKTPLEHNDHKGLERYFDRHNVYSSMEAVEALRTVQRAPHERPKGSLLMTGQERRRWLKEFAYLHLPCRPLFKFLWAYLLKRGILDGRLGFRYCVLQSFYEYQVSLKLIEIASDRNSPILKQYIDRELPGSDSIGSEIASRRS
jgi:glycosyltransferase involved in cell wall biosynthesis